MTDRSGLYKGRHYTTYVEEVKALKRAGDYVGAERLLLALVGAAENEARANRWRVAPGYYNQLAIIYRKTKQPDKERRCCTARSKSLTSLCRLQSHPAQYVSGIPSAAILLSISHPIRCSTRCLANVRARISGPMIAL